MAIRPGKCYHHITKRPYTRISVRVPRRSYVKGVPVPRIHQFEMGNVKAAPTFPLIYHLISRRDVQMRSNCLEAARVAATKYLTKKLGENFFMKILIYPHHVLRENPLATGAGADRFSEGMAHAFGKPIGTAARVASWQSVIMVRAPAGKDADVKEALRRAARKLPGACRIVSRVEQS
jgi:large subunit ribosomal protein L10e